MDSGKQVMPGQYTDKEIMPGHYLGDLFFQVRLQEQQLL